MTCRLPSSRRGLAPRQSDRPVWAGIASVLIVLAGCDDPATLRPGDVRVYDSAKESAPQAVAETPTVPTATPPAGRLALRYEPPPGWTDRGAKGMRLATLVIGEPDAGHEVTVIPAAGTLDANVSRWLGQLDPGANEATLAERTAAALAAAEPVEVDGTKASIVLLQPEAGPDSVGEEAILGAAIPLDDTSSLFVKFKGPIEVARRERDNFVRFVSSIRWK